MTIIYDMQDVGNIIKIKRTELGITQPQLADMCGNGTRFISDLENGKPTMQIGKVLDTLRVLGFDIVISDRGNVV